MGSYQSTGPLMPPARVGGNIALTGGAVFRLIDLIQAQLEPNCPGAGQEVVVSVDGSVDVYFGYPSKVAGAISDSNYGIALGGGAYSVGPSYTFRSSFPGSGSPLDINVYTLSSATLHVLAIF